MESQYDVLSVFVVGNMVLRKGKTVELQDGDFLKIDIILQADTNEVFLQGRRFRKTTRLGGIVSGRPNEVCWIEEMYLDGSFVEETISVDHVIRIRQLRLTNKAYQSLNVSHTMAWPPTSMLYKDEGILFCRIKYEVTYKSHAQKAKNNSFSFVDKCVRGCIRPKLMIDSGKTRHFCDQLSKPYLPQLTGFVAVQAQ